MAKLTQAQRKVLLNLAAGRPSDHGFAGGRSTAGGLHGTVWSLRRRGFLSLEYPLAITEAGREALKAEDGR